MNVSEIVSEYGAYYKNGGQGQKDLYRVLRTPFQTEAAFTPIFTDDTIYQASKVTYAKVLQPFQKAFTPTATAKFEPLEIRSFHLKGDVKESPDDVEANWLGFLASSELKRSEWPVVRYLLENEFYPQLKQDLETDAIGRGSFVSPTNNVASDPGKSMDGFQKILAGLITDGRTTPITMGAIPTDNKDLVLYMEDFADQIDTNYYSTPMDVICSQSIARRYARGYRDLYGKDVDFDEKGNILIKLTNLTLKGLASMNLKADGTASSRIFATPKKNMVMLKKKTQNMSQVDIQPFDREVKIMTDFWLGVGFILGEIVFCNDQA